MMLHSVPWVHAIEPATCVLLTWPYNMQHGLRGALKASFRGFFSIPKQLRPAHTSSPNPRWLFWQLGLSSSVSSSPIYNSSFRNSSAAALLWLYFLSLYFQGYQQPRPTVLHKLHIFHSRITHRVHSKATTHPSDAPKPPSARGLVPTAPVRALHPAPTARPAVTTPSLLGVPTRPPTTAGTSPHPSAAAAAPVLHSSRPTARRSRRPSTANPVPSPSAHPAASAPTVRHPLAAAALAAQPLRRALHARAVAGQPVDAARRAADLARAGAARRPPRRRLHRRPVRAAAAAGGGAAARARVRVVVRPVRQAQRRAAEVLGVRDAVSEVRALVLRALHEQGAAEGGGVGVY